MDEEKRVIKAAYRKLGDELAEHEEEMVKPDSESLVNALTKGNQLFSKVVTAIEGSEDSKFMAQISYLGKKKVHELKTASNHFSANEFVDKLAAYTLRGQCEAMTEDHWSCLGSAVQTFLKHPPAFKFLLGSFGSQPLAKKETVKKVKLKDDNSKDKRTDVKKVVDAQETLETTAHDVTKRVLPELIKLYNNNGREPIDYYEFVIDPDSFGVTVENMFHVSFLIRDGLAEIKLDEDGLPAIKPTIYGESDSLEGREKELQSKPRKQLISLITKRQWEELKKTFKIKKARIPRRHK